MRLGQENWKLWSLYPWPCLLIPCNRGAEGQGGERTGQPWSCGGFNSKRFICCQGGSKHLWEGASPGQGHSSRAPAHTEQCFGMQQRLGGSSGAAAFPSPPAQAVLNDDTFICLSPRTPLRATCDHCPGHIPPLPPPPTTECRIFRVASGPLGSPKSNPFHLPGQQVIFPLLVHSSCHTSAERINPGGWTLPTQLPWGRGVRSIPYLPFPHGSAGCRRCSREEEMPGLK